MILCLERMSLQVIFYNLSGVRKFLIFLEDFIGSDPIAVSFGGQSTPLPHFAELDRESSAVPVSTVGSAPVELNVEQSSAVPVSTVGSLLSLMWSSRPLCLFRLWDRLLWA